MTNSGDIIAAGDLLEHINKNDLHDESFKFKLLGGRKIYGYMASAWRPVSTKDICIADKWDVKAKLRWIDDFTKLEIV